MLINVSIITFSQLNNATAALQAMYENDGTHLASLHAAPGADDGQYCGVKLTYEPLRCERRQGIVFQDNRRQLLVFLLTNPVSPGGPSGCNAGTKCT